MDEENIELEEEDLDPVRDKYIIKLLNIMNAQDNETREDVTKAKIREFMENIYPFIIVMYGILILVGTLMNCGMIHHITRNKFYRDPTYALLINIAISDLIKCIFVLPLTVAVLLIENWIFGKFLCYFLPILQDMPIHISMMTYLLIAADRYRLLSDPGRPRIPAFVCAIGSWFFAVCIVLPHPIYTTYVDLEFYEEEHFRGLGLCVTNLSQNIEQYIRGLFVLTYIAPLAITAYIYVKSSRELQMHDGPFAIIKYETRIKDDYSEDGSSISDNESPNRVGKRENCENDVATIELGEVSQTRDVVEAELDICKEKRTQKYLSSMIAVFGVLFCPLMLLKLVKLSIVETDDNIESLDITFTIFIWVGFLSTLTTPILYAAWQTSRLTKERLKMNWMFGNARLPKSSEDATETSADNVSKINAGTGSVSWNKDITKMQSRKIEISKISRKVAQA